MVEKKFFRGDLKVIIPSNITSVFSEVEKCSLKATLAQITKFLQTGVPCEAADIFEYDDRTQLLLRLSDGRQFTSEDGGISYEATARAPQTINIPHSQAQGSLFEEIDSKMSNRSVLVRSMFHNRQQYIITLRARPNAPSFNSSESRLLTSIAPVICDAVRLSKWLEKQESDVSHVKQQMRFMTIANEAMESVSATGCDRWDAILRAAKQFFECEKLFIALFDGRNMRYVPGNVKCRFEDCTAGTAYNYREPIVGREDNAKSRFNPELYKQLGIEDCQETLAFPYRSGGKVAGAIEIINPKEKGVRVEEQRLFGNLVSCLLAAVPNFGDPEPVEGSK
jgi:hypothetical protein